MEDSTRIPETLLCAKEEAAIQASAAMDDMDGGPWDQGHWANRK